MSKREPTLVHLDSWSASHEPHYMPHLITEKGKLERGKVLKFICTVHASLNDVLMPNPTTWILPLL